MEERYNKLASREEIDSQIKKIAEDILKTYDSSPLFVALLRGAAPFTSKLMFELNRLSPDFHAELDYMMVSTYGTERTASEPHIITDLAPSTIVKGRDVVVLDDVLDKGITADFVYSHLKARGAKNLQLAVLCDKKAMREKEIEADYAGFEFSDNWLTGMGMDDVSVAPEAHRWLEEIWEVKR
ncbi:MAG TPA: phosphoribosyltransferase family protein [Candidatus Saccharimonadales bacterium]